MPYGTIKIDAITFTDGGVDKSVPVSGLVLNPTFTGNVTVTGTISGNIIQGGTTVSGLTVTGTTANFASGVFTTQVSGLLITGPTVSATTGTFTSLTGTTTNGTTASFTTGNFTSLTGTTTTGTTANFASGVFTTQVSGLLITGPTVSATTGTFTSLTGTTTTGTTANFASGVFTTQISGVTITGTTVSTTTGNFTSLTGTTATITSGIIASGTAALPSLAILSDPNTGIYSPGADQLAVATNGTGRLFVDAAGGVTVPTRFVIGSINNVGGLSESTITTAGVFNTSRLVDGSTNPYLQTGAEAGIVYFNADGTSVPGIVFRTAGAERLRIRADGTFEIKGAGTAGTSPGFSVSPSTPADSFVIDSSGRLGIGTSSPLNTLNIVDSASVHNGTIRLGSSTYYSTITQDAVTTGKLAINSAAASGSVHGIQLQVDGTAALAINSSRQVGIGTASPSSSLVVSNSGANGIEFGPVNGDIFTYNRSTSAYTNTQITCNEFVVRTNGSNERARIDTSGRLLVGTSNARANFYNSTNSPFIQLEGNDNDKSALAIIQDYNANTQGAQLILAKNNSQTINTNVLVALDDTLGVISFQGNDNSQFVAAASIAGEIDGTPGANDMPGRLVFSTTADGASSPTERMRISQNGQIDFGNTTNGAVTVTRNTGVCAYFDRRSTDGTIIQFEQDGTAEGTISVSGTTISYNGAHLSRWSQLPSGTERTEILRGSVLSNLDEMCEWGEEDNEQLNRMKVSDVEGDKNVSGVFQCWDDDDDTYTDDFYCAMTGDFIIRIAESVTVERGDLLMSAGDGTAKPQDDDIIRSKTVAKVTSTNVSCTYEDGSYCVPCVLMAC